MLKNSNWFLFILEINLNCCLIMNILEWESNSYDEDYKKMLKLIQMISIIEEKQFDSNFNFFVVSNCPKQWF